MLHSQQTKLETEITFLKKLPSDLRVKRLYGNSFHSLLIRTGYDTLWVKFSNIYQINFELIPIKMYLQVETFLSTKSKLCSEGPDRVQVMLYPTKIICMLYVATSLGEVNSQHILCVDL